MRGRDWYEDAQIGAMLREHDRRKEEARFKFQERLDRLNFERNYSIDDDTY